jgi:hypothetical protein
MVGLIKKLKSPGTTAEGTFKIETGYHNERITQGLREDK